MENYGYLERGTLIQVGTVLKVGDDFREVISFRPRATQKSYGRDIYNFTIIVLSSNGSEIEYDKQDLEDMLEKGTLKIYNEG